MRFARRFTRKFRTFIKPIFTASLLTAELMCSGKSATLDIADITPLKTPQKTKTYEVQQTPSKATTVPELDVQHQTKTVRKGSYILRHHFPLEKPGILLLKVDVISKRGIFISGDTSVFRKKRVWVKYNKKTILYGSAMVLELHAKKNGPDSATIDITYIVDK